MRRFSWFLVVLLIGACAGGGGEKAESTQETASATADSAARTPFVPVEMATRSVACGCVIAGIGSCGNYIEIDEKYVKIANSADLGLGSMEWCGKEGVTAESAGEIRDGQFVAATLVVHPTE
jgi:hypothetical protein